MSASSVSTRDERGTSAAVRVLALKHAFSEDVCQCEVPAGLTLREIVGAKCGDGIAVTLDSVPVPPADWDKVRAPAGSVVTACPIPHGDQGKSLILTIGLIAAAYFTGGATLAAGWSSLASSAASGAVYAVGSMLISKLIKPPTVTPDSAPRRLQNLTGTSNEFRPYQVVPVVYGQHKIFPPHAALPWTEVVGDDQYLNCLFAIGVGEHDLSEAKIGETLLTNYQGVELTQTTTPSWPAIIEDALTVELEDPARAGTPVFQMTSTTADNIEAVSVDFMAPIGLRYTTDKAERFKGQIDFRVEFRRAATADPWTNVLSAGWVDGSHGDNVVLGASGVAPLAYVGPVAPSPIDGTCFRVEGNTSDSIRFGMKWFTGSSGQWDVRITRVHFYSDRFGATPITAATEFDKSQDKMMWTVMRSHDVDGTAVDTTQGVDFVQLRIKASDVVQGQLNQFNVIAHRRLRGWDKGSQSFTAVVATRSPAWAYIDMLTGRSNARAVTDPVQKIWLDEVADWAQTCADENRKFDRVFDQDLTVFDVLGLCASAGRAGRSLRDARFTIITEEQGANPTQLFTPRNSRNFSFQQQFIDMPHALKCRFLSEQQNWQQDEILVYDDGYDAGNATKFETITFDGKTDPNEIWRFGRYHLAQARLRPALYTLDVDVEFLASVRGDLVHVEHDAVLWNLGRGRVTRVVGQFITLDEDFTIISGTSYKIKVRSVTTAGTIKVLEYDVRVPVGFAVSTFECVQTVDHDTVEGDLVIVGEAGHEDVALKILAVEPRDGLEATLTLVDAAPEINDADSGTIPDYNPNITNPVHPEDVVPPTPIIMSINSGSQLGVVQPSGQRMARMQIAYRVPSFQGTLYDTVEARVRQVTSSGVQPWVLTPQQGVTTGGVAAFLVEPGETYEIQIRVITVFGTPSAWSATAEHTVSGVLIPVSTPGAFGIDATTEGLSIVVDVTALEDRTVTRLHVRLGVVDDRDDPSGADYYFPVPPNFASLDSIGVFVQLVGPPVDYFVWLRFEDAYENASAWEPLPAVGGYEVLYPGQATRGRLDSATAGLTFIEASDSSGWNADHTDLTFVWVRAGSIVATRVVRVSRTGNVLTASLVTASGEPTSHTADGAGTPAITIFAVHVASGETVAVTVVAIESTAGSPGSPGADGEGYWTPVVSTGITRAGKSFIKTSAAGWDKQVYSVEAYGSCMVAFQPHQTNKFFMMGLDKNPSASASYNDLDYAWFCQDDGTVKIYENGVDVAGVVTTYVAGDQFAIQYDAKNIRYLKNGVLFHTTTEAQKRFSLDSSFYSTGTQVDNVTFVTMPGGQVDLATQIAGTLTAIFADAGLINSNVTINANGTLTAAGGGQVQINALPGSVATGQLVANVIAAVQAVVLNLAAIRAELGDVQISTTGALRSGKSSFADTTAGFWMGIVSGITKFIFGNAANYVSWDGSALAVKGEVNLTNTVQTLTPSWIQGFTPGSEPTGDFNYIDFGAFVILWNPADMSGANNDAALAFSSLPTALRPSSNRYVIASAVNSGAQVPARFLVSPTGVVAIQPIVNDVGTRVSYGFFNASGTAGIPQGNLIIYAK